MLVALLLALSPATAAPVPTKGAPSEPRAEDSHQHRDALTPILAWIERAREGRAHIDERSVEGLLGAVSDLRFLWALEPTREPVVASALLDLLGLTLAFYSPRAEELATAPVLQVRSAVDETLATHAGPAFCAWLASSVLALPHSQPIERRLAAAWFL